MGENAIESPGQHACGTETWVDSIPVGTDALTDPPIGPDGEVDWDAYYDDPTLWEKVNADIAARRAGELPVIRRRSANGSVVSAMMLGIRDALEMGKPKQEIVVQRDDSGDPDRPDKGFHLDFDPEDPTNTRATVRPWAGPITDSASEPTPE